MAFFPASFEELIDRFAALPGIGRKSAQRLAFHVLALPEGEAEAFAETILRARQSVHTCPVCQNLTDGELCSVCADERRVIRRCRIIFSRDSDGRGALLRLCRRPAGPVCDLRGGGGPGRGQPGAQPGV